MMIFRQKVALRIGSISILLACVSSPLAWWVSCEKAEEGLVSFAMEEAHRVVLHQQAFHASSGDAKQRAEAASGTLAGGLFEIAEIYDAEGLKIAEAMTVDGANLEKELPPHPRPKYKRSFYESITLPGDRWVLRVFVPLLEKEDSLQGYFEGVRLIPPWQRRQMVVDAMVQALMVGLASLICGSVLYPVVIRLSSENEKKAKEILEAQMSMLEALGRAIARRDSDTGAHNYRVAWMATKLAEAVGLHGIQMQALIAGSFLHDVGKIGIPDAILLKPGKLTAEEMDVMRTHVHIGEEIVSGAGWLHGAKAVVSGHHEKWNGSGYPRTLVGESIPLAARIFAVADVFDALCSKRPYKLPVSFEKALEIIQHDAGSHFDPDLIRAFSGIARQLYDTCIHASEETVRGLLQFTLSRYFGLGSDPLAGRN